MSSRVKCDVLTDERRTNDGQDHYWVAGFEETPVTMTIVSSFVSEASTVEKRRVVEKCSDFDEAVRVDLCVGISDKSLMPFFVLMDGKSEGKDFLFEQADTDKDWRHSYGRRFEFKHSGKGDEICYEARIGTKKGFEGNPESEVSVVSRVQLYLPWTGDGVSQFSYGISLK